MKFLKNIDLYTGLILLCLVLLPICGWWVYKTHEEIGHCEKAIVQATRSGGLLEEIGSLQEKVRVVNQNRGGGGITNASTYFERQIMAATANGGLDTTDFTLLGPKEEPAKLKSSKQQASDFVVTVNWKRKDLPMKLDFIDAMLWNCESGAGVGNRSGSLQSVWRLRQLDIVNLTDDRKFQRFDTPPPELEDRWVIKQLKFARREPKTKKDR